VRSSLDVRGPEIDFRFLFLPFLSFSVFLCCISFALKRRTGSQKQTLQIIWLVLELCFSLSEGLLFSSRTRTGRAGDKKENPPLFWFVSRLFLLFSLILSAFVQKELGDEAECIVADRNPQGWHEPHENIGPEDDHEVGVSANGVHPAGLRQQVAERGEPILR